MALPPWSFVLVGLLVTGVSWYSGDQMLLFFYVGLLFLMYGSFRAVWLYVIRGPKKRERWELDRRIDDVKVLSCPFCATPVYNTAKFCHECGGRMQA